MGLVPIRLDSRLRLVFDLVRSGARVVDVGTDHAYLPAALTASGKCPSAIALDIGEHPLQNAQRTIRHYGLSDKIETRISDGLKAVKPFEAEDIVVCGMGGELIAQIIDGADWLRDPRIRLILQPMTRAEVLREYLFSHGFDILTERAVFAGQHIYTAIAAEYVGQLEMPEKSYFYIGKLQRKDSEAARAYMEKQAERIRKQADGLKKGGAAPEQVKDLEKIYFQICGRE